MIPFITVKVIWCMITLISPPHMKIDDTVEMRGKLLRETEGNYIADFSEFASNEHYYGDYSHIEVAKNMCWSIP